MDIVCCECCLLSGSGLCDELITHPEEFYRLWCVDLCDIETTKILVNEEEAKAHKGTIAPRQREGITTTRCVIIQKIAILMYCPMET